MYFFVGTYFLLIGACLSCLALAVIGVRCFVLASLLCLAFAVWYLVLAASMLIVLGVCCLLLGTSLSYQVCGVSCSSYLMFDASLSFFWCLVIGTCLVLVCLSCLVHVSSGVSDVSEWIYVFIYFFWALARAVHEYVCVPFFLRALEHCGIVCDSFLFLRVREVCVCVCVCVCV